MGRGRKQGFTLIELMIVVAVIGILSAIAYPAYKDHVRKARRTDAKGALTGFSVAMERHFTETTPSSYLAAATGGANTGAPAIYPTEAPLDSPVKYYDLRIQAASATAYELRAAPKGDQAGDKCGTLTLLSNGTRSITGGATGATARDCWR